MQTLEPILREHPFFQGLDPGYIALLAGCASNVVFRPGHYLMKEGEAANHFYIIRQGKVSIEIASPGRGPIPIQTVGEGDILGWSWLVPPYRWQFDGRALQETRAIALDGQCLRGKCEEDHSLGYEILRRFALVMADRLAATRLQLLDLYGKDP
jgi:CRP/FNR family cyclic AMP-dependent transcriptional regulator